MKKSILFVLALLMLLSGCTGAEQNNRDGLFMTETESSADSSSAEVQNSVTLTEDISQDLELSTAEITEAKCYIADFQEITDNDVKKLFGGEPELTEDPDDPTVKWFTLNDKKARLSKGSNGYNNNKILVTTAQGSNFDSAAYRNYDEIAEDTDWDFITREGAEQEIRGLVSSFIPTGINISIYAISAETYSEYVEKRKSEVSIDEDKNNAIKAKDWGTPDNYYYIYMEQTIDGIPIFNGLVGNIDTGAQTWGTTATAVIDKNGVGYLLVSSPYKIIGEANVEGEFIGESEARKIVDDIDNSFLTSTERTFKSQKLVYIPLRSEEGLVLTPAWMFSFEKEVSFGNETNIVNELTYINAYTGDEIK